MKYKKVTIGLLAALCIACAGYVFFVKKDTAEESKHHATSAKPSQQDHEDIPNNFNKKQYSIDDPVSIWVVVNKKRPLQPKSYAPDDLVFPDVPLRVPGNESMQIRKEPANAIKQLFDSASAAGYDLLFSSGYRSYTYQVNLYNGYVTAQGQATADTQSARPGFSEHQTGLAFDVCLRNQECDLVQSFGDTPEGKWIAENAYKYGFMLRYTKDNAAVAGYSYEPWHLRYVGVPLATELHDKKISTLEDFFDLPAAPDYDN